MCITTIDSQARKEWTYLDEQSYTREYVPLWWHRQGLQQTATGYGSKLRTPDIVHLADGRSRRVYVTQYSNVGTEWIILDGARRIIR